MQQKPSTVEWLGLEKELRQKLIMAFKIGKTGCTEVMNGVVVSDGVTERDLEAMSVGRMIEYLGNDLPWHSPTLCNDLFKLILVKFYDRQEQVGTETATAGNTAEEVVAKRKGRPPKASYDVQGTAQTI